MQGSTVLESLCKIGTVKFIMFSKTVASVQASSPNNALIQGLQGGDTGPPPLHYYMGREGHLATPE